MYREEIFQDGWMFCVQPLGTTFEEVLCLEDQFKEVDIPHDWLIAHTDKFSGDIAETGWYKKTFQAQRTTKQDRWILRFDGVYMDSVVYCNGHKVCEWKNGYTAFDADVTPFLKSSENEIYVSVTYETPNSRWYSGAGIYRSVKLLKLPDIHLIPDGIYIVTKKEEGQWRVQVQTELSSDRKVDICHTLREYGSEENICTLLHEGIQGIQQKKCINDVLLVNDVKLWELENPVLYLLITEIRIGDTLLDRQVNRFGFRSIDFRPESGFYLNGRHKKLQGVCEHHDLGCLGAAFYKAAMVRKFQILKDMGVNAVRISHNMPAREVIELAEEMGILIVSELYDMWERPKNKKDFARFFLEWYKKDTASWIRRDRNSPCVIMWSIGNEIYDTHGEERGQEITAFLRDEVKIHDPYNNAYVTLASNYMPWENAQKCADLIKVAGYNYSEKYYELHHKQHPDWVIYGSETASVVQSRGIYHFPAEQQILTEDDEQCSSLGNSITSWGARSIDACITAERDTLFSCGQFLWTGFDYIGEPTPYHTKNSYFGQVDTAGFKKDAYYLYQSAWTDYKNNPMVHIYPYWDFNKGQIIDVGICSNAPEVELIVNGVSQGRQYIDHEHGEKFTALWKIPYEEGSIQGIAYDLDGNIIACEERSSFTDAKKLVLTSDKEVLTADGRDLLFVVIEAEDKDGNLVENANNRVEVSVHGAGRLVGLDNGDSTDYDEYSCVSRRMFSGKLLAVIAAKLTGGDIYIKVSSKGLETGELVVKAQEHKAKDDVQQKGITANLENGHKARKMGNQEGDDIPVRKVEIICPQGNELNEHKKEVQLSVCLHPTDTTYKEVEWSVTDDAGIPSSIAVLKVEGKQAVLVAMGDGRCRVRCMTKNGTNHICLISQMEFNISGFGSVSLNPYEFIYGGVYTYKKGTIGSGNERGIATARDEETQVGFENLDFGIYGSDEITIPIFALNDEAYSMQIWEGKPDDIGSECLADVIYQKPSIWNVYQEETYKLNKRLKNITSICFVLQKKVHIKGFSFKFYNRAEEKLFAGEADRIYGDFFIHEAHMVREIGNNVSLEFKELDFGEKGVHKITICGSSPIQCNSIHLCLSGDQGNTKQLIEFTQTEGLEVKTFDLEHITGTQTVTFLFLPGSRFDFSWLQFEG